MDKGKLAGMASVLRHCELTSLEKRFLGQVVGYFEENGELTEQQESILKGIYREKLRWMKKDAQPKDAYTGKSAI